MKPWYLQSMVSRVLSRRQNSCSHPLDYCFEGLGHIQMKQTYSTEKPLKCKMKEKFCLWLPSALDYSLKHNETVFSRGHLPVCRYSICSVTPAVTLKGSDLRVHLPNTIDKGHISFHIYFLIKSYSRVQFESTPTNNTELTTPQRPQVVTCEHLNFQAWDIQPYS